MPEDQIQIPKRSNSGSSLCCEDEGYPYGTSLSFDDELIEQMGLGGLSMGDVVQIKATAVVDSMSAHSSSEGTHKSIRLQLTAMKAGEESSTDRARILYTDQEID